MRYILLSLAAFMFIGCGVIAPSGDEEAVVMKKPWFFGHGGVQSKPVAAGRCWTAFTTYGLIFKITPLTFTENFDDLISDDNTPVDFNAYLKLQIKKRRNANFI